MARTRNSPSETTSKTSKPTPAPTTRTTRASNAAQTLSQQEEEEEDEDMDEDLEQALDEDMEEDMFFVDEDMEEDMNDEDALEYIADDDEQEQELDEEPVVAKPGKKSLADLLASAESLLKKKPVVESDSDSDSDSDVEEESVSSLRAAATAHEESLRTAALKMKEQKKSLMRRKQEDAQEYARKKVSETDELLPMDVLEEAEKDEAALYEEKMRKKSMGFLGKEQMLAKSKVMKFDSEAPRKRARVANVNKPKVFQKDGFTVAVNPFSRDHRLQMIDIAQDHVDDVLLDRREQLVGCARRVPSTSTVIRSNQPAAIFTKKQRR